jgi:hypothetical protein
MSANFRMLFTLTYNQWAKNAKSPETLWPLISIDETIEPLTEDEMYARNKAIIEQYTKDRLN